MKLRNLFLASLAVCTMASCSKDDDGNNGPKAQVDAQISFATTTLTQQTKASAEGSFTGSDNLTNETIVKTLTAYVFKKDGALVARETVTAEGDKTITEIKHIIVKVTPGNTVADPSTDEFEMALVANGELVNPSSYENLRTLVLTNAIDTYVPGTNYLPMISEKISFSGLKPLVQDNGYVENWVQKNGGTVKYSESVTGAAATVPMGNEAIVLTRMIARVQVDQLTIDIQKNYKGAIFILNSFALANVRPLATATDGVKNGNDEYYKGYKSDSYVETTTENKGWISPGSPIREILAKAYDTANTPVYSKSTAAGATTYTADFTSNDNKDKQFVAYAFPNVEGAAYKTGLIISGKFQRYAGAPAELKHFRVILQHPDGASKVEGNYIYKLKITITGEGSEDENHPELNAHVAAAIDVAPWNVIEQNEEDTN